MRETDCTYGINVVLESGHRRKLLTWLTGEQVAFLEQGLGTVLDVEKGPALKPPAVQSGACQGSCCRDL